MTISSMRRWLVVAAVAAFSFGVGMLMIPPPEEAEAQPYSKPIANCILDHIEGLGSDRAASILVLACESLH